MHSMSRLLAEKGTDVWSIAPDATVLDALRLMADKDIGALVVLDGNTLVGMLSERDYARKVVLEGRASRDTRVRDVMVTEFPVAAPHHDVGECMGMMTDSRVRHLPVAEHGKLLGVVSIGDLVKATIGQQEFMIRQLEQYICT